jgi:hypothetical protein
METNSEIYMISPIIKEFSCITTIYMVSTHTTVLLILAVKK